MKSNIPISVSHTNLLNEWDYELNNRSPEEFSYGSHYKAFWRCPINHSWKASIYSRTSGHGCPLCRSSTSLNELIIYSELSYIFPNAVHRYVLDKNEIDIFLPDANVGVEYDGLRWHKENELKDRKKNLFFENQGIKIIRVRQKGLSKISNDDIITEKKINPKLVLDDLLRIILNTGRVVEQESKILGYFNLSSIANDSKYQELLAYHPFPFKGRSLEDKFPELTSEWNIEKNKNLTPNHFYPKSATVVWWKCSKGHEWQARISHRVDGSNCPFCSGRIAGIDNNLSIINSQLSKEWNYNKNKLSPIDYLPNSGKKVWWKCKNNHEWQATIASRNSSGTGCPYCTGNNVLEADSIFHNNKIMSIWNFEINVNYNPKKISDHSNYKVWWKCKKNHEWQAIVSNISKGSGCPFCSGHKATNESSFGNNYPNILKEWDFIKNELSPFEVSCQSKKKAWWKCKENHEWQSTVQNRTLGTQCPFCTNKIVLESKSLFALKPDLIKDWDFNKNKHINPKRLSIGSGVKAWWLCNKGHSWESSIYNRTKKLSGCPYCSNTKVGFTNSILTTHPDLIMEWDYDKNKDLKPEMFSYGSTKKINWICAKGHHWQASIGKRTSGSGCPYCSNKLISFENSISNTHPELIKEWDFNKNNSLNPDKLSYGSSKKVFWNCEKGHNWSAKISHRSNGSKCPECFKINRKKRAITAVVVSLNK